MPINEKWVKTFCGYCHANCGLRVLVKNGKIERVEGDPEFPVRRGHICRKAVAAPEVVYSAKRLKYPLLRRNGRSERISWSDALDIIATKLIQVKDQHGPEAVALVRGAPMTEEIRDGFRQFMAAYGSPNATGPSHLCSAPRVLGQTLVLGRRTVMDFERANCIVLWGANPKDSRSYGEPLITERFFKSISEAQKRGAKVIVIDPRRTALAASADEWVGITLETDLAFGLSLLHVIIEERLYDVEFVSNWTVGFDRLAEHVRELTPEWAGRITGIPPATIRRIARTYAATKPALIVDGNGLDQHPNVVETIRVISMLEAITGNIDVPGGNIFAPQPKTAPCPTVRPPLKHLAFDVTPLFPRVPFPYLLDAMLTGKPYTPRVLFTHHANPLLFNANYKKVRQALEKLELLVVYDILPTATADIAHLILPAASDFERHGFGVWAGFGGGYAALQQKVIEPVGESRSVFDVEYELAKRLGLEHHYPWTTDEEWVNYRLGPLGITVEALKTQHVIFVAPPIEYRKHTVEGFKTPTGKVELYSQRLRDLQQDPMPVYHPFEEGRDLIVRYPLVGTTRRPGDYVHTRFRDVPQLRKRQPDPLLRMHLKDAEERKISEGDVVTVESPEGMIRVKVMITDEMGPGMVIMDFGWGNSWDGGPNVNILTSDQPRCPISGATPNRRFRCQVTRTPI